MLLNECKKWLLDEKVEWYDYSDGGYSLQLHHVTDDSFEFTFCGSTCYDVAEVHKYDVHFSVGALDDNHIMIHFNHMNGHGVTHCHNIETFKLFVFDAL